VRSPPGRRSHCGDVDGLWLIDLGDVVDEKNESVVRPASHTNPEKMPSDDPQCVSWPDTC